MSSDPTGVPSTEAPDRRLHPLSWLFALIVHLRQFAVPLLAVLITGKRNSQDAWGLIGVGALVAYSLVQYFTYRYRIASDGIAIRSGLFQRSVRHIPFDRIQNVSLHRNVLHRLFGVAEVRLESAGAPKPEASMRVLRLDAANELERQIRGRGAVAGATAPERPAPPLLALPLGEILRLGLIDNRGMLVIAGAFALLAQIGGNSTARWFETIATWLPGRADALHLSLLGMLAAAAGLLILSFALVRVFSVAMAVLQFYGFVLREHQGRLSAERGLFTRLRASVPRHRIQAYSLTESALHRMFGRQSLRVDTAAMAARDGDALRDLVPIARPAVMDALIANLLNPPAASGRTPLAPERKNPWPVAQWRPLHARAWRRKFTPPALFVIAAATTLAYFRGPWALTALALLPLLLCRALLWARYSAYSIDNGLVAVRSGWLNRDWRFAETRKLQALEWEQSPFDRRHGMATLHLDTIGASSRAPALTLRYLPEDEAHRVFRELSSQAAVPPPAGTITLARTAASATPAP